MSATSDWLYVPEFVREGEQFNRVGPPTMRHVSGKEIDISQSSCLAADMLDVEGDHGQALSVRLMCAGDVDAFLRVFAAQLPVPCTCGSGMGPWWQTLRDGTRRRVCDGCVRHEAIQLEVSDVG